VAKLDKLIISDVHTSISKKGYNEIREQKEVKREPRYAWPERLKMVVCNKSMEKEKLTCIFGHTLMFVPVKERIEDKVTYTHNVVGYKVGEKVVDKYGEKVGCFISPVNPEYEVCYAYDDGFAENMNEEWKSKCKSGTSCFVRNIKTGEVVTAQSDIGVLK